MLDKKINFRNTFRSNNLPIAFIGSGISSNHSDWITFLIRLAEYSENNNAIKELKKISKSYSPDIETLLMLADECKANINDNDLREFMKNLFKIDNNVNIPLIFVSLVRTPFSCYITTNYDTNLEDAYLKYRGINLPVILPSGIDQALRLLREGKKFVLKVHGCARMGSELIIGHKEYQDTIYANKHLRYVLAALQATHPIIFMGYGHRDPHISRYLEYEQQVLPKGGLQRFTFMKQSAHRDPITMRLKRLNISTVYLNAWNEIDDILNQATFLRMRDNYKRGQIEYRSDYDSFLETAKPESAWGAIMYAYASSDLGYAEDIKRLWSLIKDNRVAKKVIEANIGLSVAYYIVIGQMLKRNKKVKDARNLFVKASNFSKKDNSILAPVRALAHRYLAIFYIWPGDNSYVNLDNAKCLLIEAKNVLGSEFEEESLDIEKWLAVHKGEIGNRKQAINELLKLATRAENMGYLKNASWCRLSAVDQWLRTDLKKSMLNPKLELERARVGFNQLEHVRGLGEVYLSFARVCQTYPDFLPDTILHHLQKARGFGTIAGDSRIISRCDEIESALRIKNNK